MLKIMAHIITMLSYLALHSYAKNWVKTKNLMFYLKGTVPILLKHYLANG